MEPAPNCRRCARLVAHRRRVRHRFPDYHNGPVGAWGDAAAPLLVVGLAPGLHGANRTGKPFQGDASGEFLFRHLGRAGWLDEAGQARGVRITNGVKCLPPENRPTAAEVNRCNRFLAAELRREGIAVVLALGAIAHQAVIKALGERPSRYPFAHGAEHGIEGAPWLVDSYHCSRYNTQTRRLTDAAFARVLEQVRARVA